MTREEMLNKLSSLSVCVLWPGNFVIDATERPIWVNEEGYGYIADDDPCVFGVLRNVSEDLVTKIKEKCMREELVFNDIKGTPLENDLFYSLDDDNESIFFSDFERIPDKFEGTLFFAVTVDGCYFYRTEEELTKNFLDSNWIYETWQELDDNHLMRWIQGLFDENLDFILPMTLPITKTK